MPAPISFRGSRRGAPTEANGTIVFQTDFATGGYPPSLPAGVKVVVRRANRFTIQADGTVANCSIMKATGASDLAGPLCQMFNSPYVSHQQRPKGRSR